MGKQVGKEPGVERLCPVLLISRSKDDDLMKGIVPVLPRNRDDGISDQLCTATCGHSVCSLDRHRLSAVLCIG